MTLYVNIDLVYIYIYIYIYISARILISDMTTGVPENVDVKKMV